MKKNLIINCEICDARNMREEDYLDYERILLNAEIVLVNETSKGILNRLPIQVNTERTPGASPGYLLSHPERRLSAGWNSFPDRRCLPVRQRQSFPPSRL